MELIKESAERIGLWKNEAIGAADILRSEMDIVGKVANQATEIKKQFIETIRGLRMTVVTEVAATKKPLDDLREFFLGDDHEKEIKRLKEFVDLCERLENLKKNGVLDAVADTILKLS